jgi:phytoene desaturase
MSDTGSLSPATQAQDGSPDLPVAVVGGGLGGLAAAATLAARGHRVVLFEKNEWVGGKAAVLEEDGYRFDMGPTILTVPRVLGRIFAEAGRDPVKEMDLVRLDPQWRCFFDDGSVLDLVENVEAMARDIEGFAPGQGEGYRRFLKLSERLHEISERFFFWKSVEDLGDTMDLKKSLNAATLSDVLALRMGSSVAGTIRSHVPDPRVSQMLDHFVQYVGSSPYGAPAVLCAIAHMQTEGGVWYPMGGTRAVPLALERLGRDLGAEYRTGTGIARVEVEGGAVRAVVTDRGERVPVKAVVSNMDSIRTYRELVGGEPARRFLARRRYDPACSGVVFYLGLDRAYDHLLHHDFVFSRDPEEEFDWIYGKGEPAPDPTCYIAAPARTEPGVAPPGGEALYVLVHTPYLRPHHDWKRMLPEYRKVVFDKLARTAGLKDLEDRIRVERHLTPQDIHERYSVLDGAIYGLASHGKFMGAFKPGNRSREVQGLYLAGGAAHPGPGMPMVMMSGWIAADALDADMGARMGAQAGGLGAGARRPRVA